MRPDALLRRLASAAVLLTFLPVSLHSQREIVVSAGGPITRITDAVAAAAAGDRIRVMPGLYREPTIVLARSVTVVGEGWPILDGEGARELIRITADDVSVSGLVLRNTGASFREDRAALRVSEAARCAVVGNRIEDAFFGIYLAKATDCRIANNVLRSSGTGQTSTANGIHLWSSSGSTIEANTVTGHRDGIYLEFSSDVNVERNRSTDNHRYGLHFMFSNDCAYRGNEFARNDAGVAVMYAARIAMLGNRFADTRGGAAYGLLLKDITDARLENNQFSDNTTALLIDGTTRLRADGNRFTKNGWAIRLDASAQDSRFTNNAFSGNTFDVATNSAHTAAVFRANFWDRYAGYDLDRDGTGDVPHRPVRLFAVVADRFEPSIVLLGSLFVGLLEAAERMFPSLTPTSLVDEAPVMRMERAGAA